MDRPTIATINHAALLNNLQVVKSFAKSQRIIAMVKANAYGCGIENVVPVLEGKVYSFGVACIEEALDIRKIGSRTPCMLLQGVWTQEALLISAAENFTCVINNHEQLNNLLETKLKEKITVWVKVNTGMNRLGFMPSDAMNVIEALNGCPWVNNSIGLMTHFSSADELNSPMNDAQTQAFFDINTQKSNLIKSLANSAAILSMPNTHADAVRPGLMLYGISPFANQIGLNFSLQPVMTLTSKISTIHDLPANAPIGYSRTWYTKIPSRIGVVPVGYADGYPRCIQINTPTYINGHIAPIVGRVSMDMLTVDLTNCPEARNGDKIEFWGKNIPIEHIAKSAGTIPYELISKVTPRARGIDCF